MRDVCRLSELFRFSHVFALQQLMMLAAGSIRKMFSPALAMSAKGAKAGSERRNLKLDIKVTSLIIYKSKVTIDIYFQSIC